MKLLVENEWRAGLLFQGVPSPNPHSPDNSTVNTLHYLDWKVMRIFLRKVRKIWIEEVSQEVWRTGVWSPSIKKKRGYTSFWESSFSRGCASLQALFFALICLLNSMNSMTSEAPSLSMKATDCATDWICFSVEELSKTILEIGSKLTEVFGTFVTLFIVICKRGKFFIHLLDVKFPG